MKFSKILFLIISVILISCDQGGSFRSVSAKDFAQKIKTTENPQILDVRTPDEFESEHLENAQNVNWNSANFTSKVASYNKSKPIFVYCLSGGRSIEAATKLHELGFKNVFDLEGGIMYWKNQGLPTAAKAPAKVGMSMSDFDELLHTDKKVLVDFYAEWCEPCKKLEPVISNLKKEMGDKAVIIRIDVDKNKTLAETLKITQIPTILIYENKAVIKKVIGPTTEEDLKEQLQ
jgi:thioredoxin